MSMTLHSGDRESVELTAGKWVRWQDLSRHPNRKATKAWAMHVTGTHEKYGVDGDWLETQTIDGSVCFDVSDLVPGDIIKVSGASHSNKKHAYYEVEAVNGEISLVGRTETEVVEMMEESEGDAVAELRDGALRMLRDCDDADAIRRVIDVLNE